MALLGMPLGMPSLSREIEDKGLDPIAVYPLAFCLATIIIAFLSLLPG